MSTIQSGVVVVCDDCGHRLATACTTSPTDRDQCPSCRPQPQPEGLLAESNEGEPR